MTATLHDKKIVVLPERAGLTRDLSLAAKGLMVTAIAHGRVRDGRHYSGGEITPRTIKELEFALGGGGVRYLLEELSFWGYAELLDKAADRWFVGFKEDEQCQK